MAWDKDGTPGPWSEAAQFAMGLLTPSDWTAEWIEAGPDHADLTITRAIREGQRAGITWARATHRSIRCPISSSWATSPGLTTLEIQIPANMTATVRLPLSDAGAKNVTESGTPLDEARGVRIIRAEPGQIVLEIGSGT